ncbi:uncharacterized protein LOC129456796 [Periophthalmus magnuspinnatus]|uniref:uncharacterized protein LOC129456796 n=1 Tax=Periophthalmus magnuspinnatus TaxID=409849 RepID=UPI002436507E|nr:uncharacterized protein LOC129456796 [Periophthalmus magnuspinnatus]
MAQLLRTWCKVSAELSLSSGAPCVAQCEKCSCDIRATFTPSLLHPYSTVLGHLQLHNTTALDLLLNRCLFTVGCLTCSHDSAAENLSYGQTKELNCEHCHDKLSLQVQSARFLLIQPRSSKTGPSDSTVHLRAPRDPPCRRASPSPRKEPVNTTDRATAGSGSPAVVGLIPVMFVMTRTRTIRWNWPRE